MQLNQSFLIWISETNTSGRFEQLGSLDSIKTLDKIIHLFCYGDLGYVGFFLVSVNNMQNPTVCIDKYQTGIICHRHRPELHFFKSNLNVRIG